MVCERPGTKVEFSVVVRGAEFLLMHPSVDECMNDGKKAFGARKQ